MTFVIAAMPAYNEERSIAKMVFLCRKYVEKVVVVDDGSEDSTADIAEAMGAYVVRHSENMGYGGALKSCFETARKIGADRMIILDSDEQHDPGEIPKLLKQLDDGTDIVIGSRFINGNGNNVPAYRMIGMKVLDIATNIAGDTNVSDSQSGFRAYGKKAIEKININGTGMSASSEVLMQIKENNLSVREVEIHCNYDVEDPSSQNPVSHGVKVLIEILGEIEFRKPLYYLTLPGMVLIVIGFAMGISFIETWRSGGQLPFGPTLLMIFITLLGVFSVFTGIILHSLSGLFHNMKLNDRKPI
ncbi:MAG: glycosyltransferase family 2 protein [Candidatus Methanoperedens sp.]|nr:glycosyltransferase family 2 protein [Candidatus Methanoperedens sp.]